MYTRNSQSAVTSDEDRGDKSTLPREVSSEKKKKRTSLQMLLPLAPLV